MEFYQQIKKNNGLYMDYSLGNCNIGKNHPDTENAYMHLYVDGQKIYISCNSCICKDCNYHTPMMTSDTINVTSTSHKYVDEFGVLVFTIDEFQQLLDGKISTPLIQKNDLQMIINTCIK